VSSCRLRVAAVGLLLLLLLSQPALLLLLLLPTPAADSCCRLLLPTPASFMFNPRLPHTFDPSDDCRRPGILVLINDCDWELRWACICSGCGAGPVLHITSSHTPKCAAHGRRGFGAAKLTTKLRHPHHTPNSGMLDSELQVGDTVVFISTLHGG